MKQHMRVKRKVLLGLVFVLGSAAYGQTSPGLDTAGIADAMGKKGQVIGETYKVSFPRSDLRVMVGKVRIKPALALGSWAAFVKSGSSAVAYGDLVLLEDEINPVISKLEDHGIEIAALHNHLLHETPRVVYIHFMGQGDELALAKGLRAALALTKTPMQPQPPSPAEKMPAVAEQIEEILGAEGAMSAGVLHVNVPRPDIHVTMMGTAIPASMGMNTALNFQIEGKRAAINGDFMLLASEVSPVMKALRAHGIEIAALHNHMLDEEPRLFFMHYWAYGDAVALAKGLKGALEAEGRK